MTVGEYDEAYREALLSIPNVDIGEPYIDNGQRYCRINEIPRNDFEVFALAWGLAIAGQIRQQSTLVRINRAHRRRAPVWGRVHPARNFSSAARLKPAAE